MSCCCLKSPPSSQTRKDNFRNQAVESEPMTGRIISTTNDHINSFQDSKDEIFSFWATLESVNKDLVNEGIDFSQSPDVRSILNVAGDITQVIIPTMLGLSSSVPFVGTIGIVLVQFYSALNQTMQNRQQVQVIEDQVNDSVRWLGQSCRCFNDLKKLSPETFQQFHERVKFLTAMIGKSSNLIVEFSVGSTKLETLGKYSKRLFFNSKDQLNIESINRSLDKARNDVSLYMNSVLAEAFLKLFATVRNSEEMKKIEEYLPEILFEEDIQKHLSRFVLGSREWMNVMA